MLCCICPGPGAVGVRHSAATRSSSSSRLCQQHLYWVGLLARHVSGSPYRTTSSSRHCKRQPACAEGQQHEQRQQPQQAGGVGLVGCQHFAAAAVVMASSMFTGWGSWLGMSAGAPTAASGPAAARRSPLARKGSSMSNVSSHSKLGV